MSVLERSRRQFAIITVYQQVDEIVVLDHGRVPERGTHAQLIRSGGTYHRLWQAGHPGRPA